MAIADADKIVDRVFEACAKRENSGPKRNYLGMSEIGRECDLRLWRKYNGEPPNVDVEGRTARVFDMGRAIEARVIADLRLAGYKVHSDQLALKDFDDRFQGHIDGIIEGVTSKPHLLEIKSANHESFKDFQANGLACRPVYEAQVQCYMGYSGLKRALFVVENKNSQELYMERVNFDQILFNDLRDKAWFILNAIKAQMGECLESEPECRFCEYRLPF
ncbi:MAG: hypothetical protein LBJ61_00275 [Deltaproteobacteria bacterium]|jgi:hypothetical protein|nr:hypothetical protein [Deltaproteobacteria bacterium]